MKCILKKFSDTASEEDTSNNIEPHSQTHLRFFDELGCE